MTKLNTDIFPLIKGYRLIKKLAAGEHTDVYLAEKGSHKHSLALKILQPAHEVPGGNDAIDRFVEEYELIAGLDHPNIVKIHALGIADDHVHIAMEFLSGGDLKTRMERAIAVRDVVSLITQIASAVATLHVAGILHCDLKPGNIMLREDGSIALIDFGLARRVFFGQDRSGKISGTPCYMSPEQGHADEIDERSDIYSLGIIFYEMLTGERPYRADNPMAIIYQHRNLPIPILPAAQARFQPLIDRMLAKRPQDRLQNADEIVQWF